MKTSEADARKRLNPGQKKAEMEVLPNALIMSSRYIVIMAGGRGERFWPKSRLARPKHLQSIVGDSTMLEQTIDRVTGIVPTKNILVITNAKQRDAMLEVCPQLGPDQIIAEPVGRDTAAAVGLATLLVEQLDPEATYAILPADHVIHDGEGYAEVLKRAFEAAEKSESLVTIGIQPDEPATGYGYIHVDKTLDEIGGKPVYSVERFVEKPDLETAKSYLEQGGYYWNAGMFIWKVSAVDAALKAHAAELYEGLEVIRAGLNAGKDLDPLLAETYPPLKKISVDFAIMEKAENVTMVESGFDWDDVGAWPAIERHYPKDDAGNVVRGLVAFENAKNNIVVSENGHLTAVIGVDDLIVVHTPDATLVCRKDQAQDIKKVVKALEANPDTRKLT